MDGADTPPTLQLLSIIYTPKKYFFTPPSSPDIFHFMNEKFIWNQIW